MGDHASPPTSFPGCLSSAVVSGEWLWRRRWWSFRVAVGIFVEQQFVQLLQFLEFVEQQFLQRKFERIEQRFCQCALGVGGVAHGGPKSGGLCRGRDRSDVFFARAGAVKTRTHGAGD